jgi:hypothetical protein
MSSKYGDPEIVEQVTALLSEGVSGSEIGRRLGICRGTVRKIKDGCTVSEEKFKPVKAIVDPEKGISAKDISPDGRHKFVITSALNDCPIDDRFLASLEGYCETNGARLIVIPVHYKNVSLFSGPQEHSWDPRLAKYFVTEDIYLSSNIKIMGSLRIQATAAKPLQSLGGISKGCSAVFGHPRVAIDMIPTPLNKYPLVYATTGSISEPSYSDTKTGKLGEFHHTKSAFLVETDGDQFWWRHLPCNAKGGFTDFETEYLPEGYQEAAPAEALIVGDIHVGFHTPDVIQAIFGGVIPAVNVKNVVLHDLLDFFSASHHGVDNKILQVAKHVQDRDNVRKELTDVGAFLNTWCYRADTNYFLIDSNHHNHLEKWLDTNSANVLPKNLVVWHHLNYLRLQAAEKAAYEYNIVDLGIKSPLEVALNEFCGVTNLLYPSADSPLEFGGIDCSNHGHRGPNGSRGSRSGFSKVQRKTFIGHSHTPGITDGCYQVGMSCDPKLPYTGGYSSWLHCDGLVYADGQRTLFPVIAGKYRMEA